MNPLFPALLIFGRARRSAARRRLTQEGSRPRGIGQRRLLPQLLAGVVLALTLPLAGCSSDAGGSAPGASAAAARGKAGATTNAVANNSHASNAVAVVHQSVFHMEPQFGRDPFYPGASRTTAKVEVPITRLPLSSYLKLVGIRPGTTRPMALINRTALAPGEEASVSIVVPDPSGRLETLKVNIKCVEVRRDSVVITIEGEEGMKELRLAQAK